MDPYTYPQIKPGSLVQLTENKLSSFVSGAQKKSRFQKQKEAQEIKKKQDELAAAKVYESFVAAFESTDDSEKDLLEVD